MVDQSLFSAERHPGTAPGNLGLSAQAVTLLLWLPASGQAAGQSALCGSEQWFSTGPQAAHTLR